MTVYLIQTPRTKVRNTPINIEPAKKFGRIVPILHEDVNASQNTALVLSEVEKGLRSFNPVSDFLLWVIGDPLSLVMVGIALSKRGIGYFNWLRYNKKIDANREATGEIFYTPVKVPLPPYQSDLKTSA